MQRVLDGCKHPQHVLRGQLRIDQAGAVEIRILACGPAHGQRLAIPTDGDERHSRHESQQLDSPVEVLTPSAQIGAASDEASCHGCSRPSSEPDVAFYRPMCSPGQILERWAEGQDGIRQKNRIQ
jgi:endogenous inhibitor of DNA gyrase (YacG/DUF329 family)